MCGECAGGFCHLGRHGCIPGISPYEEQQRSLVASLTWGLGKENWDAAVGDGPPGRVPVHKGGPGRSDPLRQRVEVGVGCALTEKRCTHTSGKRMERTARLTGRNSGRPEREGEGTAEREQGWFLEGRGRWRMNHSKSLEGTLM